MNAVAVHGFPLDWNLWQIHEWPSKLDEIRAVTDLPIWVDPVKEMLVDCRSTGKNFRQCIAVSS